MLEKLKNNYLSKVILIITTIWIIGSLLVYSIESSQNDDIGTIWDALWLVIVTMTTVGYGDIALETASGRVLSIIMMLSGICLIAIVTGTISSIFTTNRIMEGKGLSDININNHTLICGWNTNIIELIDNLVKYNNNLNIVLINNQDGDEINNIISHFKAITIKYVKGDYSLDSVLIKANITKAKNAIILNDRRDSNDEKVILSTLTIKKISPNIKVIAQINDKDKTSFLKRANVDAVLSNDNFESFMATSHISNPSVAHAINNIIDKDSKNNIISKRIPDEFIGKTFSTLFNYYYEKEQICLGLFQEEENIGISEFLSSDASAIDKFIEEKLEQAGHTLDEKNTLNINLNPTKDYVINKGQGALILL